MTSALRVDASDTEGVGGSAGGGRVVGGAVVVGGVPSSGGPALQCAALLKLLFTKSRDGSMYC